MHLPAGRSAHRAAENGVGARSLRLGLACIALAILLAGAWNYRWMTDDGLIHLRIVQQIEAGNGPVFNAGERVEASTSPLWTWLLVAADALLPLPLEWIAVLAGIALSVCGLALAMLGAAELTQSSGRSRLLFPLGGLVLAVLPAMWLNASTGLENGLAFAWLGACVWRLARWAKSPRRLSPWTAALVGVGTLVRPEFVLVSIPLLAAAVGVEAPARGIRGTFRSLAAAFAIPVAYQLFRMGYYASLTPNSGIAKEAGRTHWIAGWKYLHATVDPYWLWVPLAIALVGGYAPLLYELSTRQRRRAITLVLACLTAGLLDALFIVRVGGDFYHARLLLFPLFLLLAPVALVPCRKAFLGAWFVLPWAVVALVSLRSKDDDPRAMFTKRNPVTVADYFAFQGGLPLRWFDGRGLYFVFTKLPATPVPGRDPSIATLAIGATAYALGPGVYIQDMLGLADAFGAHLLLTRRTWLVGHEKPMPAPWVVAKLVVPGSAVHAEDLTTHDPLIFPIDDPDGQPFEDRVADARSALACGAIRELQEAIASPLTPKRFVANVLAAPRFWSLRVPPEPRVARAAFCEAAAPPRS
jgi:arabinofuranosyltransferase